MTSRRFHAANTAAGLVLALTFPALVAACSGGDEFTSTGGSSGSGGATAGAGGGSAATGGTSAQAGSTGATAGMGGTGASSGAAGTAGGSAGKGGAGTGGAGTGGSTAGAAGAGGGKGGAAGSSTGGAGGGGGAPACDPTEKAPTAAIHVLAGSKDNGADGTEAKPFGTLAAALAAQKMGGGTAAIVLGAGTYDGATTISGAVAGAKVSISGGYTPTFTRDCGPGAIDKTILTATQAGAPAVLTIESGETVSLSLLTVKTRDQAEPANHDKPGVSLFAIVVRDGADLTIDKSSVIVGKGGLGGPPSNAANGMPPMCDGVTDCSDTQPGMQGAPGAPGGAGVFSDTGYSTGDGNKGGPGTAGKNGKAGKAGDMGPCVSCSGDVVMCTASTTAVTADPGKCGCGGLPGDPAQPGRGGGASVGVFVTGSAKVTVTGSTIKSGDGGDGSASGDPGGPSAPTVGTVGANQTCEEANGSAQCLWSVAKLQCVPVNVTEVVLKGGETGGMGAPGGKGGQSGGGSGGSSVAVVFSSSSSVSVDATSILTPGLGGKGGGAAPMGMSVAKLKF